MNQKRTAIAIFLFLCYLTAWPAYAQEVKIWAYPYLQNPTPTSVDIYWVSEDPRPCVLHVGDKGYGSVGTSAPALHFDLSEVKQYKDLVTASPRFVHHVEVTELAPNQTYDYRVDLHGIRFASKFTTLPKADEAVRFIAYADSETEPESSGTPVKWPAPGEPDRRYLVDQTDGYRANLKTILERRPQAVLIAGDLVESGGEQRDWDEFWNMNTGADGQTSLASQLPILPALGNHEYFAGPNNGRYSLAGVDNALARFFTYFHPAGANTKAHYYRQRLGPASVIALDSCDGLPHRTPADPNYLMSAAPKESPGIGPTSAQYQWLEKELAAAQQDSLFTFVFFHHCPYSSGPHGFPAGTEAGQDTQSGQPLRVWTPLFMRYGVDAVLTGHDEMFERSTVEGTEITARGQKLPHTLQFYDVGVGGDGLRLPVTDNPRRQFLADTAAPEQWTNGELVAGGRHYGHLEVNITPSGGGWTATLDPVYVFPIKDGSAWRFERRIYPDRITLQSR